MRWVLDSGEFIHEVFGCLFHIRIFHRWCLLRALFCADSTCAPGGGHFSDNQSSSALHSSSVKLFSFHAIHLANSFMGDFAPLVARLMVDFTQL